MVYDSQAQRWYALFAPPLWPMSTTGGVQERGQYGIELYKIPQDSLLTGASPWQQLVTMDTNATGFESNFIAAFVRDSYGNVNVAPYPTIQMYTSISYPPPNWAASPAEAGITAAVQNWILMPMQWVPDVNAAIPFNRYFNGTVHEVTTGWISPGGRFQLQELLGHLYTKSASRSDGAVLWLQGRTNKLLCISRCWLRRSADSRQGWLWIRATCSCTLVSSAIPLQHCARSFR